MSATPGNNNNDDASQFAAYLKFYTDHKESAFQELGVGSVTGFCAGYFTRKMVRLGVVVTGGLFVGSQFLSQKGYISIEWNNLEKDAIRAIDQNGDGKIDEQDLKIIYDRYVKTLQYRLPSSGGFAAAFLLGWKGKFI